MNTAIIELQRELLLEQLMEIEEKLNDSGIKKGKQGFTLFLRNGVFCVKYTDIQTGKQIPTNTSLRTTDRSEAEILAKKYRESILKSYFDKKNKIKDLPKFFSEYYDTEKVYERKISKHTIRQYKGFINNYFLDFLEENRIKRLNEITLVKLKEFQQFLRKKKLNPKTINDKINGAIKPIFANLVLKGVIKTTPFVENLKFNLPQNETRKRPHTLQIYETLAVLLDKEIWKLYKTKENIKQGKIANEKHYKKYRLLCLLMATCGLRNAEIFMLRKENIIKIRRTYFIDVVNSHIGENGLKTESSKRKVPIPTITLEALNEYIEENNITDYLFYSGSKTIHYNTFWFAKNQFGTHCGYDEQALKDKNIEFYSFRHLYKTMLTRSHIKDDVIEYFMGHSVDLGKMNERYNNIEDLDDYFFENLGISVIQYIDNQFQSVMAKYELLPIHTHLEQVSLTDNKGNAKAYYTNVLSKIEFEEETNFFIGDLQEKGSLPNTNNKEELLNGLETLLENGTIDKRRYDDCIDFVKNMKA